MIPAGMVERGEREQTAAEVSKAGLGDVKTGRMTLRPGSAWGCLRLPELPGSSTMGWPSAISGSRGNETFSEGIALPFYRALTTADPGTPAARIWVQ
jgi:hypothetical protein